MKLIIQIIGIVLAIANIAIDVILIGGFWGLHWWGYFTLSIIALPFLIILLGNCILSFTIHD